MITVISCFLFTGQFADGQRFLILFFLFAIFNFLMREFLFNLLEKHPNGKIIKQKKVAIWGFNESTLILAEYFKKNDKTFSFEGFLNDGHLANIHDSRDELSCFVSHLDDATRGGVTEVYTALSNCINHTIDDMIIEANKRCIRLKFISDFKYPAAGCFKVNYLDNIQIISPHSEPLEEGPHRIRKRLLDITVSLFVLSFILSWLYPLLAIIIKFQSPGPVLFKQKRTGRDNQQFWCYKFRSMYINNESDTKQVYKGDCRITRVGKFLRKTSLDEFPQFFNVLIGNMSVVGPRPHMLKHTDEYSRIIANYMVRQYMKPGITGFAQINGLRGETRDVKSMEERVKHDIWYLENWKFILDLKIIIITVFNIFTGKDKVY